MRKKKVSKYISHNTDTDMSYIDGKYTVDKLFHPVKHYDKSNVEPDSRFLWEWERSWIMFKR